MAIFSVNTTRLDPYKNFKFQLKKGGHYVAGISKVSSMKRSTEVITHSEGGKAAPYKMPGHTKYEAITVERGLTQDLAFQQWAGLVWNYGAALGAEMSLASFRSDLYLELYNEAGQLAIAWKIYRCWVSEYQALPDLDANANAVAIEHLKIENEGWERDTSVTEQLEPTLAPTSVAS